MSPEELAARYQRMEVRLQPPFTFFHRKMIHINCICADPPTSVIVLDCGHLVQVVGYLKPILEGRVFCALCKVAAN